MEEKQSSISPSPTPPSQNWEEHTIRLLKEQDEQVINLLYTQYAHILLNIILRIVKNEEIAQDVFQEALVKIWQKGQYYDEKKGSLFTWVVSICRNAAIDKTRSKSFKLMERKVQGEITQLGVEPVVAQGSEAANLTEWVQKLPENQKILIDLSYFQGYTHEEIAKKLDIPLGTVKTRIRSAIKKLRKVLYT